MDRDCSMDTGLVKWASEPLTLRHRMRSMPIRRFALFHGLEGSELDRVSGLFTKRSFRRGERIPGAGRRPMGLVLLIEGRLRVRVTGINGREFTVRRYCAGSVAGLGGLLPETERWRGLETVAESDGWLAQASIADVSAMMGQSP